MTTDLDRAGIAARPSATRDLAGLAFAAALGLGLLFVAGFAPAALLHDVAHDQRHALALPCH